MTASAQSPAIDYDYRFPIDAIDDIKACLDEKGFAMVADVIPDSLVETLKAEVWRTAQVDELPPAGSRTVLNFIEIAPGVIDLLRHKPYIEISEALHGTDDLVLHRTAAIARCPGNKPMRWHTDHSFATDETVYTCNDVLNRTDALAGFWFYLTGSRPSHGGLCVIEGSHRDDWEPPAGFAFEGGGRKRLVRDDGSPIEPENDCIPGCYRLIAKGGDLMLFANKTFHAPLTNNEDQVRLSCGIGFRPRHMRIDPPWEITEDCRRFLETAPADIQRFLPGYTSIDPTWRNPAMKPAN